MNSDYSIELAHTVGVPILKLFAHKVTEIISAPQAQKRTAKFKKAVKIVNDLVFKGPYTYEDRGLINSLKYTYALQLLETALQLSEWQRGSLPWEYVGCCNDNQCYLVAKNVGMHGKIPSKPVSTKIETNVKVVPRKTHIMRVSDIEGNGQLTDDVKLAALQHLYLRFLLDIGDSGTHNVLIRKDRHNSGRLIAGIDLDETRGIKDKQQRLDHLFKKAASKKQISLYKSDVCKIRSLSYSQLDQHTLKMLNAVGINLERLKGNMKLWGRMS